MVFTLRPYQQSAVTAALEFFKSKEKGVALEILPTGSGKSVVIANIAKELDGRVLILQPSVEILHQNFQKFTSYGYRAGIYSASAGSKFIDNVTFATIGSIIKKKHLFADVKYIIIDECFPSGTLVDGVPIESINVGDSVSSFNHNTNKIEQKKVVRLFKKQLNCDLIKITLLTGESFVCTENHPIFIKQLGYISAIKLFEYEKENNYKLYPLSKRNNNRRNSKNEFFERTKTLLFKRVFSTSAIQKFCGIWIKKAPNKRMENPSIQSNEGKESYVDGRSERKNDSIIKRKNFSFTWWKRSINKTSNDVAPCDWMPNGISNRNKTGKTFISICSKLLQSRFSLSRKENCNRSGWGVSQIEKMEVLRQKENGNFEFVGLASVEIYKRGSGKECGEMCKDGYVYNIEVEDNHNYFVHNTLVHNCHLVNAKEKEKGKLGMYAEFIRSFPNVKLLGLTATPYRLSSSMEGAMLKFLTRTKPRIFTKVIYSIQNNVLFDAGHLAKLEYFSFDVINRKMLKTNSSGTDFTEASLRAYYRQINMPRITTDYARRLLAKRKNLLVFCSLIEEANTVAAGIPGSVVITGETEKGIRAKILSDFKSGKIKCLINVGVLTTGFDYPELECILMARSTMSLSLYYQIFGRGMRPHPDKKSCWLVDLGGNINFFGKIETMKIEQTDGGLYFISNNGRPLTNVVFSKN